MSLRLADHVGAGLSRAGPGGNIAGQGDHALILEVESHGTSVYPGTYLVRVSAQLLIAMPPSPVRSTEDAASMA